ncbi:hypothetical protein [Moorena sp. SIO3A2]|uniref:hypothetical protein n=1 Tax=Moorena sp. SIO3A2 TaxID=2607841 RepID=UPI0013B6E955|nr:hypothetical protein [Moorena sp. SIO3A2]NER90389.1 hypothetical protein [Moorena sp. SIO3A2]
MSKRAKRQPNEYVAPMVIIPGLELECYKLLGDKNYRYSLSGAARNYWVKDLKRIAELLASKEFKSLPDLDLEKLLIWAETKGGVQKIASITSDCFVEIGFHFLCSLSFNKANKDRMMHIRGILRALSASKLDDMAAQLFGDQVNPIESFKSHLPGLQLLTDRLKAEKWEKGSFTVSQFLVHVKGKDPSELPFTVQTLGRRASELGKCLTFKLPIKDQVEVVTSQTDLSRTKKVQATQYFDEWLVCLETAYRSLMLQNGLKP